MVAIYEESIRDIQVAVGAECDRRGRGQPTRTRGKEKTKRLSGRHIEHLHSAQIPVGHVKAPICDLRVSRVGIALADRGKETAGVSTRNRVEAPDDLRRVALA